MSELLTGSQREPAWLASVIKGKLDSALRARQLQRTGLAPFVAVDWSQHFCVQSQQGNSCLGVSLAQNIYMRLRLQGERPNLFPNGYRFYNFGRRRRNMHLEDNGAYTGDVHWAANKYGVSAIPELGFNASAALHLAPSVADNFGAVDMLVTTKSIYDQGERLVLRICDSLAKGQPVQLSLPVEPGLGRNNGPELIESPTEPGKMGHAMAVIGCRQSSRKGRWPELLIGNSYGSQWREGGTAWLTGEYAAMAYSVRYVSAVTGFEAFL